MVTLVRGFVTQAGVCLAPTTAKVTLTRISDVTPKKATILDVLTRRWALRGLTTQKHRSHAITVDNI